MTTKHVIGSSIVVAVVDYDDSRLFATALEAKSRVMAAASMTVDAALKKDDTRVDYRY